MLAVSAGIFLIASCGGSDSDSSGAAAPTTAPPPTQVAATATATATAAPTATPVPPTPTPAPTATAVQPAGADLGKSLAARNGCSTCHSADGAAGVGPTWLGLFGKEEELADGRVVTADDAYLRLAITDPDADVVKGFPQGIMPRDFGEKLSDDQVGAIIEYIKTLR